MSIERPSFFSVCNPCSETRTPALQPGSLLLYSTDAASALGAIALAAASALAATALAAAAALAAAVTTTTSPMATIDLLQLFRIKLTHMITFLKKKNTAKPSRTETV